MVEQSAMTSKLSKNEIEQLKGQYDSDGFYLLDDGGFYDPLGYYFDKDGLDKYGGRYDESGLYVPKLVPPIRLCKDGSTEQTPLRQSEFEQQPGSYDEDGFYILQEGGFYDPFGFYFDKDGLDEAGGSYDEAGYYVAPFDNDFDEEDLYGDEASQENPEDELERQAIIDEHVI